MKSLFVIGVLLFVHTTNAKVTITKLKQCEDHPNYKITFDAKVQEVDGKQVLTGTLKNSVEIGDGIINEVDVFSKENNDWKFMISVKESMCNALHNYLGDFGYHLQEAAGIKGGTCPIPPGEYSVKDFSLDFTKFKYKNVPHGTMRLVSQMIDSKTNEKIGCSELEFTLDPN